MIKIVRHKTSTTFYCEKKDHEKLRKLLDKYKATQKYNLGWYENRYRLCYKICNKQTEMIREAFTEKNDIKKESVDIITGFVGCLIWGGYKYLI